MVIQEHRRRLAPALPVMIRTLDSPLENRSLLNELERKSIYLIEVGEGEFVRLSDFKFWLSKMELP